MKHNKTFKTIFHILLITPWQNNIFDSVGKQNQFFTIDKEDGKITFFEAQMSNLFNLIHLVKLNYSNKI